jgi:hypothetical protein
LIVLIADVHLPAKATPLSGSMNKAICFVLTLSSLRDCAPDGPLNSERRPLALRSFAPDVSNSLEKRVQNRPDRNSETPIGYSLLPIRSQKIQLLILVLRCRQRNSCP